MISKDKTEIETILKKYTGNFVFNYLNENRNDTFLKDVEMQGKDLTISVYNLDLSNSIGILSIETIMSLLIAYYNAVISSVEKNNGFVVNANGNELICVHGLINNDNSIFESCKSSFDAEEIFNKLINDLKLPASNLMMCGINTGVVLFGSMGSDTRLFLSIMGDNVSLTSNLSEANKLYKTKRIITDFSIKQSKELLNYREIEKINISGPNSPLKIYELVGLQK